MAAMLAGNPTDLQDLVDAVIHRAPACIRERTLLQSVDWRKVDAARVEHMLGRLEAESIRVPAWLARSLLLAGHVLPASPQVALDAPLHALNGLNRMVRDEAEPAEQDGLDGLIDDLAARTELDAEILTAATRKLKALRQGGLAARLALAHWNDVPQALRSVQDDLAYFVAGFPDARLRVAGFSTTHGFAGDLGTAFAAAGFKADVTEGEFGQVLSELMQPNGEDERDSLLLLLDFEGLHAPDWRQDAEAGHSLFRQKLDLLGEGIEAYLARGRGILLVNTLPLASAPTAGLLDMQHSGGTAHSIDLVNQRLVELARNHPQLLLIDGNRALSGLEPRRWTDFKLWFYGRIPYSAAASRSLAGAFAGAYRAVKKGPAKVLALDLDNTLWGGVFGEDGLANLRCDSEFPGNAFRAFQHECLRLKGQGMLLALLSKNNPDAITAFEKHPGMLLKEEDFVATRINWEPKPHNIRSMAKELNLGVDSFVFIDDSPHEREAMRRMCPELTVPEMPDDPAARPAWLRSLAVTWPTRLTGEDSRRSDMYLAERRRNVAKEGAATFEDYLANLDQTLIVEEADAGAVARVAQMHQRTNQFNLTTERFDDAAIKAMSEDENCLVLHGRALDKFGDHGQVICATARVDGEVASIESFLMSCRVIGRFVEQTFLGELLRRLAERGVRRVAAAYLPTAKNALVKDFYRDAGFTYLGSDGERQDWGWDFDAQATLPGSALITLSRGQ